MGLETFDEGLEDVLAIVGREYRRRGDQECEIQRKKGGNWSRKGQRREDDLTHASPDELMIKLFQSFLYSRSWHSR